MRVAEQHARIFVPTDGRNFWNAQAKLKEPANRLVSQIVEPEIRYTWHQA